MPDPVPSVAPTKPPRAKPGLIDGALKRNLTLAAACHREAAKPEVASRLLERAWTPDQQVLLGHSLDRCDALIPRLKMARTGKIVRTQQEQEARGKLLVALDPVLKGARRTHPDGSAERAAYGIGEALANRSTYDLLGFAAYGFAQLAAGADGAPPKDRLAGVLPGEITALGDLNSRYKDADFTQADARKTATELLVDLELEVTTTVNPLRRDLQGAADQAFTHRDPRNGAQRQAFGLRADRPQDD